MRYVEVPPSADLAREIQCFWELEVGGDGPTEPIFPDGRVEIVVHLGARPTALGASIRQPEVMVVGQTTTALRLQSAAGMRAMGIRFTPAGARPWLGAPLCQFTDNILDLDDVHGRLAALVGDAAHRGASFETKHEALERALRQTRTPRWAASLALEHAVGVALRRHGDVRVERLSEAAGLGVRQLERQFLDQVGLNPKGFARTARLQRALHLLRAGLPAVDVAASCGFSDQAHLAREFRRVAGAPSRDVNLDDVAFL